MGKIGAKRIYSEYMQEAARLGNPTERGAQAAIHQALAARLRLNVDYIRAAVSRWQRKQAAQPAPALTLVERPKPEYPEVETYVYTGEIPPTAVPVFTGEWRLDFDQMVAIGDIHAVSTNRQMMEMTCRFGELMPKGKRHLLICGDANNGDKDSKHAKHIPPISRAQEFDYLARLMDYLLGVYDDIWVTPGNHLRNRFIELLEGDLNLSQLKRLITNQPQRVELSAYDIVHVNSGGEPWTFTHQYQYSRSKLIVANKLAQKYQCNIVTFHQHHSAVGRDEYDRYTIIDCGGGHRQDMFGYAQLVPNTMPRMNNGLVFLDRGVGQLITPYKTMTNLSLWFPNTGEVVEQKAA